MIIKGNESRNMRKNHMILYSFFNSLKVAVKQAIETKNHKLPQQQYITGKN